METQAARGDHLLVERLAEEGVGESIADGAKAGPLLEDADANRFLEAAEDVVFRSAGDDVERAQVEVAADDGGDGEEAVALRAEAREALADDVAQSFWDASFGSVGVGKGVASAFPDDDALLDQIPQELLDEERIAFSLAVVHLGASPGDILSSDVGDHALDFLDG
jgi:hypothetical protein